MQMGVCVKIPDGRVGRVRDKNGNQWKIRVMRAKGKTHQFLYFSKKQLQVVACPKGWMTPEGYNNYLNKTLAKMNERRQKNNTYIKR